MMLTAAVLAGSVSARAEANASEGNLKLWYLSPAARWTEALPLGNGRIGAMVFGGVEHERIQLNEDSLWSGGPQDADNPKALENLEEVRRLLREGKLAEAQILTIKSMVCRDAGSAKGGGAYHPYGSYQTLGDLRFDFTYPEGEISDYTRNLDLETATATVEFTAGGVRFTREIFASAPDEVLVMRFTADKPGMISLAATLDRDPKSCSRPWKNDSLLAPFAETEYREDPLAASVENGALVLAGRAWQGDAQGKKNLGGGMQFEARALLLNQGGERVETAQGIEIRKADAVTLLLSAATDYREKDGQARCRGHLEAARAKSFDQLRQAHIADYQALFNRVSLDVGTTANAAFPTDERLARIRKGETDPQLAALHFQFGRYLLIASSRPGTMPANLQGIWCDHIQAPWNADYHHNINDQMNYWPAEVCNLADCHDAVSESTSIRCVNRVARPRSVHYGADGWVVHTISNIWGFTSPGEHPSAGASSPPASGWLCQHLWEHYAFGGDRRVPRLGVSHHEGVR